MFGFYSFVSFENKQQLGTVAATHSNTQHWNYAPNPQSITSARKRYVSRHFGPKRFRHHQTGSPAYFLAGRTEERFNVTRYY